MGTNGVHQQVPATADAIARVRGIAQSYAEHRCGVDGELQSMIALAVSEAATNVVLHAYRGNGGIIDFEAELQGDRLRMWVRDVGVGVGEPSPNTGLGTGMRIMSRLADVHVDDRDGGGTEVELCFRLPATDG